MEFKTPEIHSPVCWSASMLDYFRIMTGFRVKVNDVKPRFSVFPECERGIQGKRGMVRELDFKQVN